jgi:arsenate reductase
VVRSGWRWLAPFAVGAYIGAAYFFTSSTSFASPAVTVARTLSDTFAGIAPSSVPGFVAFELIGGAIAAGAIRLLYPDTRVPAPDLVLPRSAETDVTPTGGSP